MLCYILGQLLIKITRAWANISVHTKKEKKYTSFIVLWQAIMSYYVLNRRYHFTVDHPLW